jgi:hypothetical protein
MAGKEPHYEPQGVRAPLGDDEWKHLARPERASGKPPEFRAPRRTSTLLTAGRGAEKYRRPDWIGKLAHGRAGPGEVLDRLAERLGRAPTEEALLEARLLLEDLSRTEKGQAEISRRFTQRAVDPFLTKGGGRSVR